jgi:hypothetical protein
VGSDLAPLLTTEGAPLLAFNMEPALDPWWPDLLAALDESARSVSASSLDGATITRFESCLAGVGVSP